MRGQVRCCVGRCISPPLPRSDGWVTKHLQKDETGKLEHKRAFPHEISFNMKQNPNTTVIFAVGSGQGESVSR